MGVMDWLTPSRGRVGSLYSPHKPWILASYRGGGGRPKWMKPYATQAEAAAQLREFIANEDEPPPHRYVAIIHHVTSPRDVQKLSDRSMSRSEYELLAGKQWWVAARRGYKADAKRTRALKYTNVQVRDMLNNAYYFYEPLRAAAKERGFKGTSATPIGEVIAYLRRVTPASGDRRRESRHGSAELQTGKFYAYKGHRVWLDAVPGGYFAMVEGTALQARGTTQGEALKRLRAKLDAGAANYRRGRRHGNSAASFKVAYLTTGARRTHLAGAFSHEDAMRHMRGLKRRGMTTWIEDTKGNFVPVPGALRQPKYANRRAR